MIWRQKNRIATIKANAETEAAKQKILKLTASKTVPIKASADTTAAKQELLKTNSFEDCSY